MPIPKIHAALLLVWSSVIPLDVHAICTRRPDISCRQVQDIAQCDSQFWTCEAYCTVGGELDTCVTEDQACRIQTDDVVDPNLTAPRCDSISIEMDCDSYMDCVWIDDDDKNNTTSPTDAMPLLEGPFDPLCSPTSDAQWASVPSLLGVSLSFFLQETCIPTPTCGVSNTTLGQWFILTSRITAPLTISSKDQLVGTEDTTFPTILSVFQADLSAPGTLTCLDYNSGTTDDPDQSSVTIHNIQQGDVLYVLLSARDLETTNAEVGDKAGQWRMSIDPGTAESHCAYECDTIMARNNNDYTSCECVTNEDDDTVVLHSEFNCEECHTPSGNFEDTDPSFCAIQANEFTYGADGVQLYVTHCYQVTKGVHAGNTVCLDTNASQRGIAEYRINGQACVTQPDPSCYRSSQYDCSAVLGDNRAVFNGCNADGYVGVLEVERMYEIDFVRFLPQAGECYDSGLLAPSSAPSQSPTAAEDTSNTFSTRAIRGRIRFAVVSFSAVWLLLLGE